MKNKNIKITSVIVLTLLFAGIFNSTGFLGASKSTSQPRAISQATPTPLSLQVKLVADGASFPLLLIQRYVADYQAAHPNVTISYTATGSGKGQRDFINKTMDFAASDAPLNAGQRILAPNALHIPETIGAVTAAYNLLDANGVRVPNGAVNLNGTAIANIYLGIITNWNDTMIRQLNPTIMLPNQPIGVIYRSDSSGTSFVWTSYLSSQSTTWRTTPGLGPSTAGPGYPWPVGIGAALNSGVANKINSTAYTFGYVELAYVLTNHMTVANVKNPAGNYIYPTLQTTQSAVADGAGSLPAGNADWSAVSLLNEPGANDYPIASFTYFFAYQELNVVPSMDLVDNVQAAVLKDFLNFCITESGSGRGTDLGFPALPSNVVTLDQATINSITYTHVHGTIAPQTVNLSIGSAGWSQTSLTVTTGDTINFNLASTDGLKHQFYIDFNNNGVLDPNENWTTVSPAFSSTTATPWTFTPVIWFQEGIPAAGTYTFRDSQNSALSGTIIVQPQQVAAVMKPHDKLTSALAPVIDSSRVTLTGSAIIDERTRLLSGNLTVVAVDKTSGSRTALQNYIIPNIKMSTTGTSSVVNFILNVAVSPYALSTNIQVKADSLSGSALSGLTRNLDLAGRGIVDIVDMSAFAFHFDTTLGQPRYLAQCDIEGDGVIDITDISTAALNFDSLAFS